MEQWLGLMSGFGNKGMEEIGFMPFLGVMGISLISSILIAFMYVRFYKARSTGSQIYRAFPLLSLSITAIFITIQFSLPLSLGLLGALSIVRFRTPVKEPEEIGFIMLVVAAALCCATFNLLFLSIILIIALVALLVVRYGGSFLDLTSNNGVVVIQLPQQVFMEKQESIISCVEKYLKIKRLDSIIEDGIQVTLTYNILSLEAENILNLQQEMHKMHETILLNAYGNNAVI